MQRINRKKICWRNLGGEIVILNLDSRRYYTMEGISAMIWEMISEERSESRILSGIVEDYAVDENTARRDLEGFIRMMKKEGLIKDLREEK